ncbi:MAG: anti-sigma factor [Streptosporangiaceae bacterium]|nr:anti-sigma factor [Streptosporangiaceae bacterium]
MKIRDDLHVLTGSYALDAVPWPEREEFERHLRHCPACEAEVRGMRETAARLATVAVMAPPRRMEQRVLAATYRTRQLPPLARGRQSRRYSGAATARTAAGWLSRDSRHRVRQLVMAAAAVIVAAAIGLGINQAVTQHQLRSSREAGTAITHVITAPDARSHTAGTKAGGAVTVVVSFRQRAAVVATTRIGPLPAGRVYQVWVMTPSGARSAGLFSHAGRNGPLLASGVTPGDKIGITVEPAGGTPRPTTTPIVIVPLPV